MMYEAHLQVQQWEYTVSPMGLMPGNTFLKLRFALINNSVTLAGMHIFFLRIFVCVCVLLPVFLN